MIFMSRDGLHKMLIKLKILFNKTRKTIDAEFKGYFSLSLLSSCFVVCAFINQYANIQNTPIIPNNSFQLFIALMLDSQDQSSQPTKVNIFYCFSRFELTYINHKDIVFTVLFVCTVLNSINISCHRKKLLNNNV